MDTTIGALASRPVICVDLDIPVRESLQLMSERRISSVVVTLQDEPVGIITERDVAFAANWVLGQPDLRLREVMSKPVLAVSGETTIPEAYRLFCEHKVRHLVVLGPDLSMDGIFTQTDLVRALGSDLFARTQDVTPLMSTKVWHVQPQASARYTLALMASHAISGVVVTEQDRPVGVFTERDAVRLVASGADLANLPIRSVMSTPPLTIPASAPPGRAFSLMREKAVRHLVVLNEDGGLAGVLTQTDLSRVLNHQPQPFLHGLMGTGTLSPGGQPSYAC